ncbi:PP2C family protein-serine/threonine phosphatase [Streptomyces sp. CA-106131]|uniref:PP2C family protein-serine/threonine phosphatase n=1 Tax=Streptomyces sp. CA-106131 TaxID=3240045 RepID=UPI003D926749
MIVAAVIVTVPARDLAVGYPLAAAAPVAAAPLMSFAGTIATGLVVLGAGVGLTVWYGPPSESQVIRLITIVVLTAVAAVINRLITRDRRSLRSARDVAEAVQNAVLPLPPDRIGPLAIAARYLAAHEESAIGGDLYAIQDTSHGVRLMIGDVRGKGLGAVEAVSVLLGAFREAADWARDLPEVIRILERAMNRLNAGGNDPVGFATAVVAEISSDFTALSMANRGHPAPLLVDGGKARELEPASPSLPLGLADLGPPQVPVDRFDLPAGAALVLFTDGVTEARDRHGAFYDPLQRLSRPTPREPDGLLDALIADLYRHTGAKLTDDAAMLALVRHFESPSEMLAQGRGLPGQP